MTGGDGSWVSFLQGGEGPKTFLTSFCIFKPAPYQAPVAVMPATESVRIKVRTLLGWVIFHGEWRMEFWDLYGVDLGYGQGCCDTG